MKKCLKFALIISAVGASVTLWAGPAAASTWNLSGTTIGTQSFSTLSLLTANPVTRFYTVNVYGAPAVKSITYDLSAGGYFDFNPNDFGSSTPVLDSGNSTNFQSFGSGIAWTASGANGACTGCYNTLTFNFANGTFGSGDSFSFGAATYQVNGDNAPYGINGTDFGNAAVPFSVNLWNGQSANGKFSLNQDLGGSVVNLQGQVAVVPLPGAAWLFGSGLIVLAGSTWRRKRH